MKNLIIKNKEQIIYSIGLAFIIAIAVGIVVLVAVCGGKVKF